MPLCFCNRLSAQPCNTIGAAGLKKEALESSGIWICVGCNTGSIQCPNAMDIPAVNDALRELAIEEGVTPAEPNILAFHRESVEFH
jgi:heterodisulfide reductase subunit C